MRDKSIYFIVEEIVLIFRQLINIFEQCIKFGESNSVLVIGPRGSGKTKVYFVFVCWNPAM